MFGVSTFCLHHEPLAGALHQLSKITRYVEVMDEGLHFLEDATPLSSFSLHYTIHAPSRGVNIASLLEPIRRASVEVTGQCFEVAADVGASVIIHPGYFAWELDLLDGVGFALDVGHAHLNHCLPAFLEHPIQHIHLHDNDGKEDTHMPVGTGTIDFVPVMKAVDREKIIPVIEVNTLEGVVESIRVLEGISRG
jgi:sugar phosphate isomerase/epimerase